MSEITVIIPCYNGYRFIDKCLNSLENQKYRDFDVIIIDDCSTDDSLERLKDYQKNSKLSIKIIHNEKNLKLAYTRKVGVEAATTKWIAFCDCDDWYDDEFLSKMLNKALITDADAVLCDFTYAFSDGTFRYVNAMKTLNDNSSINEFIAYASMSMCSCIFKKNLYKDVVVPQINTAEDGAVTPQIYSKCRKIAIVHEGLYFYYMRLDSLSHKPSAETYRGFIIAQNIIDKHVDDKYEKELEFIGIKNICYSAVLVAIKAKMSKKDILSFYFPFKEKHIHWHKNKYLKSLPSRKRLFLFFVRIKWVLPLKIFAYLHVKLAK